MKIAGELPYQPPGHALLWLLAALVLAVLPHVTHMPPLVLVMTALIALWWGRWVWQNGLAPRPSNRMKLWLTLGGLLSVLLRHQTVTGRDAGVALLTVMLFLKLLEFRRRRDPLLVLLLSFFLLLTHFLYDQPPWMAVYTLGMVFLLTALLVSFGTTERALEPRRALRLSATLLLQAVPVMVLLFLLFPRLPGPLFSLPALGGKGSATTGMSDRMRPDSIRQLVTSGAVAFRAEFEGPLPPHSLLYWRAMVLWYYTGSEWLAWKMMPDKRQVILPAGPPIRYRLTLEPHFQRWLFALDLPTRVPPRARWGSSHYLMTRKLVDRTQRFEMESHTDYVANPELQEWEWRLGRELPRGFNPRTRELALEWRAEGLDDRALVARALDHFRTQPFHYTLEPPLYGGHGVDRFLFEGRRGFCEHYAQAFTVLMRSAGIPARVVVGYQGGEWNPILEKLTVRQSDAHAWSEVWLEGEGWRRVDPTAAVALGRVERGLAAVLAEGEREAYFHLSAHPVWESLRRAYDTFEAGWQEWFLGYGAQRQRDLMAYFGWLNATAQELMGALVAATGVVLGGLALFLVRRSPPWGRDPVVRQYQRFCARLARRGVERAPGEGPLAFAQRAAAARPDLAEAIRAISGLYIDLRYGAAPPADGMARLRRLVGGFRP